jgi:hypothetical protein
VAHEELPEVLARVVGSRGNDAAAAEEDLLLHPLVGDDERSGFLPQTEPLEKVAREHRLQISGEAHESKGARLYPRSARRSGAKKERRPEGRRSFGLSLEMGLSEPRRAA